MNPGSLVALCVAPLLLLTACGVNSVRPLPAGAPAAGDRSVVVFGVKVEDRWDYPEFAVELAEYSVKDQAITGTCLRFNRLHANVPATPGATRYFAFDVPPGAYAYSPFMTAPLPGPVQAFAAPAGRTVYVGDFIYRDRQVVLSRNLAAAQDAIRQSLPGLDQQVALAGAEAVRPPRPFMCTP